ncbi:MAG TPA: glycosyltransferase family 4 protein [Ferruginibacter sp.]|nr:glycosyltransferase family 4 protein [Ferruginibacter sp.]
MKILRINIILPFPVTKPVGGAKIMYQYANRLQQLGHHVIVLHSIKRPYKRSRTPIWFAQFMYAVRGVARPKWFALNKDIQAIIVPEITERYVPDGDILFSTWWEMAYMINALPISKGKKINLIQDYEIWKGNTDLVDKSFSLPITHMVIARYLGKLVSEKSGTDPIYLPNAIDNNIFFISDPIENRNPLSIIMLYSEEERKGTVYGLEALKKIKEQFSNIAVTLFGVYKKPDHIPHWINYLQRPDNLCDLYNKHSIFFSPSLGEGWALPPAEAMYCGCAVVCTNIGGHQDYAFDNQTALVTAPQNIDDMVAKLTILLQDNNKRIQLANAGNQFITQNFSWDRSVQLLLNGFNKHF